MIMLQKSVSVGLAKTAKTKSSLEEEESKSKPVLENSTEDSPDENTINNKTYVSDDNTKEKSSIAVSLSFKVIYKADAYVI